jgi:DNA polymerase alpha subunit B
MQYFTQPDPFCRPDNPAVSIEDVEAFGKEQSSGKPKPVVANVFARQSWEDVELPDVADAPVNAGQRISPFLRKVVAAPEQPRPHTPAGPGKFKERCSNGAVHAVLNESVTVPASCKDDGAPPPAIEVLGAPVAADARFMVDRLMDKAAYLDHRITTFERAVEAAGGGEPHSVATAAQNPTIFVGRVCCDTENSKINPQSVLLEGSLGSAAGARVRLDLTSCPDFRLFPGQVVTVKGTNPSGFCVVASEVLPGLPLPQPTASAAPGLSAIVAAGPFTTSEDLEYEPLAALLEHAADQKPDLLLLAGPFVDADHPAVRGGLLEETFDQIFESRVVAQLNRFCERVGGATRVVLLPSPRDVHHDLTFPAGPLPADGADAAVVQLPNPATFKCNEVVLGCSSVDWLMACTKEEASRSSAPVDRLPALAGHVLAQRSYFPMFPPPATVPLDTARAYGLELPCTPHVLVTPSDLAPFAKVTAVAQPTLEAPQEAEGGEKMEVEPAAPINVVAINPGRLTKGTTAGTFAHLWVPEGAAGEGLHAACRVEIKKL